MNVAVGFEGGFSVHSFKSKWIVIPHSVNYPHKAHIYANPCYYNIHIAIA